MQVCDVVHIGNLTLFVDYVIGLVHCGLTPRQQPGSYQGVDMMMDYG